MARRWKAMLRRLADSPFALGLAGFMVTAGLMVQSGAVTVT